MGGLKWPDRVGLDSLAQKNAFLGRWGGRGGAGSKVLHQVSPVEVAGYLRALVRWLATYHWLGFLSKKLGVCSFFTRLALVKGLNSAFSAFRSAGICGIRGWFFRYFSGATMSPWQGWASLPTCYHIVGV